jgi:hypothetical protein
MARSAAAFDRYGISMRVVRATNEEECLAELNSWYDVLLLQEPPVYESLLDHDRPVILLERVDGAQLRASRKYLPRVQGVIKSYRFRGLIDYNRIHDRAHINILRSAGIQCARPLYRDSWPKPQLSSESLHKLRVGYSGFGCHDILGPCVNNPVDLDTDRSCDIHFAGTVDYENTEVDAHRRLALKAVQTWPGTSFAHAGRGVPRPVYYEGIRNSKTVLCPWGWGEATYREYEAMALGAVVIKPDTSHIVAWPDIYQAGKTYVPCKPDFSDAHEKMGHVVANWDDYRPMRELARRLVVDAWQSEAIAKRMAGLIKELVT